MSAEDRTRITYIESSALVAAFLEGDLAAQHILLSGGERITTSALTFAEAERALTRAWAAERVDAATAAEFALALRDFAQRSDRVPMSDSILSRVGRTFPVEPVRTLDAIHLVTAQTLGLPPQLVRILTRDRRVRANALALGFQIA